MISRRRPAGSKTLEFITDVVIEKRGINRTKTIPESIAKIIDWGIQSIGYSTVYSKYSIAVVDRRALRSIGEYMREQATRIDTNI